jgi:hypothetical protein
VPLFEALHAADRVASAAMWLVVHETYADAVYLDGRDLVADYFKRDPQGHTGGALNMVPAYAGYMTINALTGTTPSWIMCQGHTVAAIDSVNLLLGNLTEAHAGRYSIIDRTASRLYPGSATARVFVGHTRPEPLLGALQPLNTGARSTGALGFLNKGGTLIAEGLLFVNRLSWAHVLQEGARVVGVPREDILGPQEIAALDGEASPEGIIVP